MLKFLAILLFELVVFMYMVSNSKNDEIWEQLRKSQ